MIVGVDHVQITVLLKKSKRHEDSIAACSASAKSTSPTALKDRGGFWLEAGGQRVHVGVEDGVNRLATKAHVAYKVVDIDRWRRTLTNAGFELFDGVPIPGYDRFEFRDPFGNRVELIEALPAGASQARPSHPGEPRWHARRPVSMHPTTANTWRLCPRTISWRPCGRNWPGHWTLLSGVAERDASVCHPPYTWTIKQVVGHLTDTERIFGYRALRFARGDATPLPGFDENHYAQVAESDQRPLAALAAEFEAVRKSHLCLFENLPAHAWNLTRNRQRQRYDQRSCHRLRHRRPRTAPHVDSAPTARQVDLPD